MFRWLLFLMLLSALWRPVRAQAQLAATCQSEMLVGDAPSGCGGGPGNQVIDSLVPQQRQAIQQQIQQKLWLLALQLKLPRARPQAVTLGWPLRPAHTLDDLDYHGVSNFVDLDPAFPNSLKDYSCGQRTYDSNNGYNHSGTDFFLYPFSWRKMDNNEVAVVAASDGMIVDKQDGNDDRSCAMSDLPWNAVYVRHEDGTIAWYGHLKKHSLTSKNIGDPVEAGEYLGLVGSSGSSTGPHLHFELHSVDDAIIDPFQGQCNDQPSLWSEQRPYYDSKINLLTTGDAEPFTPPCSLPEEPHIQDSFEPGSTIYFTTYYHDHLDSQTSQYTIYRPDGSIYRQWQHSSDQPYYDSSYWFWIWQFASDEPVGTWRFEEQYIGNLYTAYFNIGAPTTIQIASPNGGEQLTASSMQTITWNDNLGGNVRLELYRDQSYFATIAQSAPSTGEYAWLLPSNTPAAENYQIRITNTANPTLYDESDASFQVLEPIVEDTEKVFLPLITR